MRSLTPSIVLLSLLGLAPACAAAPVPAEKLELGPCTAPGMPPDARCGTYEVFENREAKSGRKIPLRVVVIPAFGPERLNDPLVYFEGGPGDSSVAAAGGLAEEFKALRRKRDILLVDFRGTGGSGGLFCPELQGSVGLQGFLDDFLPAEGVKRCAERLRQEADLTQYTNATSVDDVDEVRAALGYDKVNLMGGSGGSRSGLIYLRRHPDKVRTAALSGLVPPDERGPFSMARSAQDALDGLIAECQGDAACRAAFPRLREDVAAVFRRVEREPVVVSLTDAETGKPAEVRLSRNGVAQTLRYMLYGTSSALQIPLNFHLAAEGDWKPMAETARFFGTGMSSLADGYYLALTCSEDVAFIREEEVPAAVAGTFLGDFRIRKQQAACAAFPAARVGREFMDPVVSDVPVLLVSGERDPVTPAANAERAARTLKNSKHLVVPDGGHGYGGIEGTGCITDLITALIETGSVAGLDTAACAAGMKRQPFVLAREPEVELPADQLARLAGIYEDEESGFVVKIEPLGRYLRSVDAERPPLVLVPTSPTRFRIEGLPPGYAATFQLVSGRATAIVYERPGQPAQTLARKGG